MKKVILVLMLAGSISVLTACNSGSASKDGVDSVQNNEMPPSNRDTSKTVTSTGGATLLDYTASGGTTIPKGKPSARTTMNAPAAAAPAPVAAADTAKKDTVKK
jgi:ABC-type oligopeptide transport system substrate-binding subunit